MSILSFCGLHNDLATIQVDRCIAVTHHHSKLRTFIHLNARAVAKLKHRVRSNGSPDLLILGDFVSRFQRSGDNLHTHADGLPPALIWLPAMCLPDTGSAAFLRPHIHGWNPPCRKAHSVECCSILSRWPIAEFPRTAPAHAFRRWRGPGPGWDLFPDDSLWSSRGCHEVFFEECTRTMQYHSHHSRRCLHHAGDFAVGIIFHKSQHKHFRPSWIQ